MFYSWLARRKKGLVCSCHHSRSRLRLEPLEDRSTPAVFVVTTAADVTANDGVRSLREAINEANDLGGKFVTHSILFDMNKVAPVINLGGILPTITANITISGPGAGALTINGNGAAGIFNIGNLEAGVSASINGLTLRNG